MTIKEKIARARDEWLVWLLTELAARAIYLASTGTAPDFFANNEAALADIKRCAGVES